MTNFAEHKIILEQKLTAVTLELETIATYEASTDNWEVVPEIEEGGSDADENTNADLSEDLAERTSILSTLEREYRDLKRALNKIEIGTYGLCEISHEPIEEKRLLFKPEARTCVAHMNEEGSLPI